MNDKIKHDAGFEATELNEETLDLVSGGAAYLKLGDIEGESLKTSQLGNFEIQDLYHKVEWYKTR